MSQISDNELKEIYAFSIQLATDAGNMLLDGVERRCSGGETDEMEEKMNAVDIVTKMDNGLFVFYFCCFNGNLGRMVCGNVEGSRRVLLTFWGGIRCGGFY